MKIMSGLAGFIVAFAPALAVAGENCTCRANGVDVLEGDVACLHLPSGDQLARCERVLNNTSWKKLQDGCPVSHAGGALTSASTGTPFKG